MTKYCLGCGTMIPDLTVFCPHCGVSQNSGASQPIETSARPAPTTPQEAVVRKSRFLGAVAVLGVLLLFSIASLGSQLEANRAIEEENVRLESQLASLQSSYSALQLDYNSAQYRSSSLQSQVGNLQSQVQRLQADLAHPTLTIWNSCGGTCSMTSGGWRAGGVPDTFTYYPSFSATVPITTYFLTLDQYVDFHNCGGSVSCVSGTYQWFSPRTELDGVFHLAEGCASYVAVYTSSQSGTMFPDVKVTYNPASSPTGACA
jgi:hypothetical protein